MTMIDLELASHVQPHAYDPHIAIEIDILAKEKIISAQWMTTIVETKDVSLVHKPVI